jgi:hypothetical protein
MSIDPTQRWARSVSDDASVISASSRTGISEDDVVAWR